MDFVVELPELSGYDVVMTIVDSVSKRIHFIPTYTTITTEGMARLFLYHVWKLHGLFNDVVLDRGLQFVVLFTRELYHLLRIEIASSTAWHSQLDEQTK